MLAYKERARVRLVSRNGVDHTLRYTDVAATVAQLWPSTLVLDGELAVFDEQLRSRFEWLRDLNVRFTDEEIRADPALTVTRLRGPRTP